ncbi:hypothetical protein [Corynebacterium minutissimum]|uniref:Uncharacterized protein n=1 Tax=Corynebacterium minutissimum TaxID=38301 RepID=A0A2X4RA38_9CORY|nr:hypothetical protein [Corynebacterium minutissimum]QPS58676.1 hypothetical protein I6G51_06870 [Corynebacterium minutissimum]QQA80534.1 hypothetical protein I6H49_05990 [Corynebacterium minutissimum]SQI00217.1 Uncharacterised protein [Corynebacterium minutissimum]VEG05716.1 Uncharacterised protein [Corynebacterium minutissimum]
MEAASDRSQKRWSRPNTGSEASTYGFTRYRERDFKAALGHAPRWAACSKRARTSR